MHYLGDDPVVGVVNMDSTEDVVRKGYMKNIIVKLTGSIDEWKQR